MSSFQPYLEKVTALITRQAPSTGRSLLLFQHPHAGVQIPAGTLEDGETPEQAVLRESWEETGLDGLRIVRQIGWRDELPPGCTHVIHTTTTVYSRPDSSSFDWARLPRGAGVCLERERDGYAQMAYTEYDRFPDPQFASYQITGWVPVSALAITNRRHFFHLAAEQSTPERWEHFADNHRFQLFWAPFNDLPLIVEPQNQWLEFVQQELGYRFE